MEKYNMKIYTVKRNGSLPKSLKGTTFNSYETARSAVRKYIRTMKNYSSAFYSNDNPAITEFGFSIKSVG
jgi:hypothetical protein